MFCVAFCAFLHCSRAGTLTAASLSWSRPQPDANPLAISFVLRCTWLAGSMSSALTPGTTFSDGFFCPIDGQIPKCVAAQLLVVALESGQLFSELRSLYTFAPLSSPPLLSPPPPPSPLLHPHVPDTQHPTAALLSRRTSLPPPPPPLAASLPLPRACSTTAAQSCARSRSCPCRAARPWPSGTPPLSQFYPC